MIKPPIIAEFDPPPIPDRRLDWRAARSEWDLGMPIGYGATKEEAIADLLAAEELLDD